jgi:hypothetical protein
MEKSFKNLIDQSRSLLILLPLGADVDEVAAGLSLYLAAREGREAVVFSPTQMTVNFNRLVGVNKINNQLGNKNLVIKFSEYKANDIERVSYDIEDGEFKLTVIPKSGMNAPSKDQISLEYSGVSADSVVLIGGDNENSFPALNSQDMKGLNIIHVGTRQLSLKNQQVMSFAKAASSVSEILANLIKDSGFGIDSDIATNLVIGIEEGSKKFTDNLVNADTFAIFSELLRNGGKRTVSVQTDSNMFPPGAVPGQIPMRQQVVENSNPTQTTNVASPDRDDTVEVEAPKDWYTKPKVYKGTSVS